MLSKIPNSKRNLLLVSVPSQGDTNKSNIFFIGQVEKGKMHLWIVVSNMPVAEGRLAFENHKAKAGDVKKFLSKYADEFVRANKPTVTLKKVKGIGGDTKSRSLSPIAR
jgi:hypothetical protein